MMDKSVENGKRMVIPGKSRMGGGPGGLGDGLGGRAGFEEAADQAVEGERAGTKKEDDESGSEEGERVVLEERVLVMEDVFDGVRAGGEIGDDHHENKRNGGKAAAETDQEQKAAEALGAASKVCVQSGERDAETMKKIADLWDTGQFAFAGDEELPAPV
jgi:hypothetical protein